MVHNEYGIRVMLSVRGVQDTAVTVLERPVEDGPPVIQVRTGAVLTYVHGYRACAVAARAWAEARALALRTFRSTDPGPVDVLAEASCQLTLRGEPGSTVTAYTANAAPDRTPCVLVQVGPLSVRALDTAAVTSMANTWTRADLLAGFVFDQFQAHQRRRVRAQLR